MRAGARDPWAKRKLGGAPWGLFYFAPTRNTIDKELMMFCFAFNIF